MWSQVKKILLRKKKSCVKPHNRKVVSCKKKKKENVWKKSFINRTVVNSSCVKLIEIQISIRRKKWEKSVFFWNEKFCFAFAWETRWRIEFHMWYQKKNKSFIIVSKTKQSPQNFLGDFILKWMFIFLMCDGKKTVSSGENKNVWNKVNIFVRKKKNA